MLLLYVNEGFIIGILIGLYFLEGFINLVQNLFSSGYRTLIQENAITVVSNYIERKPLTAYNLTVEEYHTYFVAGVGREAAVWVHNARKGNSPKNDPDFGVFLKNFGTSKMIFRVNVRCLDQTFGFKTSLRVKTDF